MNVDVGHSQSEWLKLIAAQLAEHPFEALHPGHGGEWFVLGSWRWGILFRHDVYALFAVGCKLPMKSGQIESGPWDQRRQSSDEIERREHDVGSAIAKGLRRPR